MFPWVVNGTESSTISTVVSLTVMLIAGFLASRLTGKLRLPNVTGYILAGILIGPFCLNMIPQSFVDHTEFLTDIALSFIAFSTGEFFRLESIRKNGLKVIVITLFESLLASLLVYLVSRFALNLSMAFSVMLAALAAATAPASTMMTIRQTGAKGDFVETLLQVVAFDDIVGLLAFSVATSLAVSTFSESGFSVLSALVPILINLGAMAVGGLFGGLLKLLLSNSSSRDNRLIILLSVMFSYCALCTAFGISPLLGCMAMSTVYINLTDDERLFRQLGYFSPPVLLLFFVRSGVSFDLGSVLHGSGSVGTVPLLAVGIAYFFTRIAGKYLGAFTGCAITRKDRKVRNYLGLALVPQAGVAIGLAALGARTLGGEAGSALNTIIMSSSILYELTGPGLAKLSLYLSGSYSNTLEDLVPVQELNEQGQPKTEAEKLIERVQAIEQKVAAEREKPNEDERVFTEEAMANYEAMWETPWTRRRQRRYRGGRNFQ